MQVWRSTILSALLCAAGGALLATPTVAHAAPNETTAAREHYKRGTTLYDLGKYDEAITEFSQAYEIKDDPVLLYNIAQAYRLSNKYNEALRFYRNYLRKSPKAANREEVEQKIADMETLLQTQSRVMTAPPAEAIPPRGDKPGRGVASRPVGEPRRTTSSPETSTSTTGREPKTTTPGEPSTTGEPTETPPDTANPPPKTEPTAKAPVERPVEAPPPEKPGRTKLIAGIVLAGAGLLAVGAGVGMGMVAMSKASEQEMSPVFLPDAESTGKSFTTIGYVLDGVGGALLVAGGVLIALGVKDRNAGTERPAQAAWKPIFAPAVSHSYAGGSLHFRF